MSIKPDHWIEKMAREYGMIEPFEAGQVKEYAHENHGQKQD